MSDHARLSQGFVNWQGQRVFVPWFGALRIGPSADDEARIVKLRDRAHVAVAIAIVSILILLGIALWLFKPFMGSMSFGDHSVLAVMLSLVVVFGWCWWIERKQVSNWPIYRLSRQEFLSDCFRSLPMLERLAASGWNATGMLICLIAFLYYIGTASPLAILCALAGPLPLGLIAGERCHAFARSFMADALL